MCTATWLRHSEGYELFFNRDELRTRQPALPPVLREREGVKYLAPTDGDKGGTWLGVNEYGLTVGLLNRYQDPFDRAREYDSRGWLTRDLLACHDDAAVNERLANEDLTRFPPFTLLTLTRRQTRIAHWNGEELWREADADACVPLSSSSYRAPEVIAARREQFRQMLARQELTSKFLGEFHLSHKPQTGPFAVCMHREDAQTVSFSCVTITATEVLFEYHAGSPCAGMKGQGLSLPIRG
jgi:uncharacterized protein with NRDE domain